MNREDIQDILRSLLERLRDDDEAARIDFRERGKPVYGHWTDMEDLDGDIQSVESRALLRDLDFWKAVRQEGDFEAVRETVDELLHGRGADAETWRRVAQGVIETFIKAKEVSLGITQDQGFSVLDMPAGPVVPAHPMPTRPTGSVQVPAPLASTLVSPFFEHRLGRDSATNQVVNQERGTIRRFLEVCGDRPVNGYGRGDITAFLDRLRQLPNTYGKAPNDKDRPLSDLIAEAQLKGSKRLQPKTVKRHLSALSGFFRYAVDQGHLTVAARTELVDGHAFKEAKAARQQRDSWTPDDLKTLFASPCWTGSRSAFYRSEPGQHIERDAKFWLPLLALFHGARLEEFADLYGRDIDREDGVSFFRITALEGRRLKTANAERVIPVHPMLIRLGFLDYVGNIAPRRDDPLFPDLEPQGRDQKRGPRITRWFVEYRKAQGLYRPGVGMHAFRHTANTRLRDAITDYQRERHVAYLLGHSQGGGEGRERYDKGPGLKALATTLATLSYPEISLSHLYLDAEKAP